MPKSVPPAADLRNPRTHLDIAAGLPGAFEALFAELPAVEAEPDPEEGDGPHSLGCPCWRCNREPAYQNDDEALDMARDLAADRRLGADDEEHDFCPVARGAT